MGAKSKTFFDRPDFGEVSEVSNFSIVCPIVHAQFCTNDPFVWHRFEQTLDELRLVKKFKISGSAFHIGQLVFTHLTGATKKQLKSIAVKTNFEYSLLWLDGTLSFPGSKGMPLLHYPKPEIGPPHTAFFNDLEACQHWNYFIPNDLRVDLQTFLMSVCIASAGAVMPDDPRWTINNQKLDTQYGMINPIIEGVEFLSEHGVQFNKSLPVDSVHK